MKKLKIVITVLLSVFVFLSGCTNSVYYLEPEDLVVKENTKGKKPTEPEKPLLTLKEAKEKLEEIKKSGKTGDYDIRVKVEDLDELNKLKYTIGNMGDGQFVNLDLSSSENINEIPYRWMSYRYKESEIDHVKSIVLPSSVKTIGEDAFAYCENLEQVVIPEGVEDIYIFAFLDCKKLKHVKIPASVKSIVDRAFLWCDDLEKIEVSPQNKYYENVGPDLFTKGKKMLHTFANGSKREKYEIPSEVERLQISAFSKNKYLKELTISKNVKNIGEWAFADMSALKSVVFEDEESTWNHGGHKYSPKGRTSEQNCDEVKNYSDDSWTKVTSLP